MVSHSIISPLTSMCVHVNESSLHKVSWDMYILQLSFCYDAQTLYICFILEHSSCAAVFSYSLKWMWIVYLDAIVMKYKCINTCGHDGINKTKSHLWINFVTFLPICNYAIKTDCDKLHHVSRKRSDYVY